MIHSLKYVIARTTPSGRVPHGQILTEEFNWLEDAQKELIRIQSKEKDAAIFERTAPDRQWFLWSIMEEEE